MFTRDRRWNQRDGNKKKRTRILLSKFCILLWASLVQFRWVCRCQTNRSTLPFDSSSDQFSAHPHITTCRWLFKHRHRNYGRFKTHLNPDRVRYYRPLIGNIQCTCFLLLVLKVFNYLFIHFIGFRLKWIAYFEDHISQTLFLAIKPKKRAIEIRGSFNK